MIWLDLTLFGGFAASVAGEPVTQFRTDKMRALLAYLALHPERPFRRDVLATLLWSEWADQDARRNLRQTLHRLRQMLDELAPPLGTTLLTTTRQTVQLNGTAVSLDVTQFQQHLHACENHPHAHLYHCASCLERMQQAESLYQGDLLAGFSLKEAFAFEEWLLMQRESLYQQQLNTLYHLTLAYEEQGAYEKAGQYAQRQIQQEPWREEAHRQLMRLLAGQGQRAEAIAQYQACRQVLQTELGVAPAAETETLLAQIVEGSLPVAASARTATRSYYLPSPTGPLIGRETEIEHILAQLADPACRLLTVTGPGGIGKTSLALAVGERLLQSPPPWLADGLYFVSLADATGADYLPTAVAETLALPLNKRQGVAAQVEQFLRPKAVLLVLDSLAPLAENISWLRHLMTISPRLKVVVTAREPLNRQWEWRYPLAGLAYPQAEAEAETFAAVQFFVQTAEQVQPGFAYTADEGGAIIRICQLVHGWPLALQMAAAWVRLMSCQAIAAQIDSSLDLLTTSLQDIPPRQRSIRVIFDHTWRSLSDEERYTLEQLALFRGGFTLAAAIEVATASHQLLLGLVDRALVQYEPRHDRYRLHQMLRQFALEKAQANEAAYESGQEAHGRYYLQLLHTEGERLNTVQFQEALEAVKVDVENVRQAWMWAARAPHYERLAAALRYIARFYEGGGPPQEAVAFFRRTLAILEETEANRGQKPAALIAAILYHMAGSLIFMGQYAEATTAVQAAQEIAYALADVTLINDLFMTQARIFREQGEYEQAHAVLQEAITFNRRHDNLEGVGHALHTQGNTYWSMSAYDEAVRCYEEGRRIYRQLGNENRVSILTGNIGTVQWRQGLYHEALAKYEVALAAQRKAGNAAQIGIWLGNMGLVYVDLEEDERALAYLDEALTIHEQLGRKYYKIELYLGKVALYLRRGELDTAVAFHKQASDLAFEISNRTYLLNCDFWQVKLYAAQGRPEAASQLLQSVLMREFRPDMIWMVRGELARLTAEASAPIARQKQKTRL